MFLTLGFAGEVDAADRDALDALVRSLGGQSAWRTGARAMRSYALLDVPSDAAAQAVRAAAARATVFDEAIIAIAVFPTVPEALPALTQALGGPGRPAGILGCAGCDGGVVVEWDLERTPASVVLALIDVELERYNSSRMAEVLTPLPPAWVARIAADGLQAPQIGLDRELETLIERNGLSSGKLGGRRV